MTNKPRTVALVNGELKNHKTVCISMYIDDIISTDEMIETLKRVGYTKANRSWLIRQAIEQFDLAKLPQPEHF